MQSTGQTCELCGILSGPRLVFISPRLNACRSGGVELENKICCGRLQDKFVPKQNAECRVQSRLQTTSMLPMQTARRTGKPQAVSSPVLDPKSSIGQCSIQKSEGFGVISVIFAWPTLLSCLFSISDASQGSPRCLPGRDKQRHELLGYMDFF